MKRILSIFLLSTLATTAMAEGLYAAVEIGQSTAKDACSGAPPGISCNESGTAFRFGGGYQFSPNLGFEANYGIMGAAKFSGTLGGSTIDAEYKPKILQIAAIGTFPIADAFSLIGKLGIARTTLDISGTCSGPACSVASFSDSATTTKMAWGIGAQYDLSKNLGIRAQYEDLGEAGDVNTTGTAKMSLISAGIVMKF